MPSKTKKPRQSATVESSKQGAFSRFFSRQQQKVNVPKQMSSLLTHFAEDDLKRIAVMIQKWLENDDKQKTRSSDNANARGKVNRKR